MSDETPEQRDRREETVSDLRAMGYHVGTHPYCVYNSTRSLVSVDSKTLGYVDGSGAVTIPYSDRTSPEVLKVQLDLRDRCRESGLAFVEEGNKIQREINFSV